MRRRSFGSGWMPDEKMQKCWECGEETRWRKVGPYDVYSCAKCDWLSVRYNKHEHHYRILEVIRDEKENPFEFEMGCNCGAWRIVRTFEDKSELRP